MQMKVEKKIRDFWASIREFHDVQRISMQSGINRTSISQAIHGKECSTRTFLAINEYFLQKKQQIDDGKEKAKQFAA